MDQEKRPDDALLQLILDFNKNDRWKLFTTDKNFQETFYHTAQKVVKLVDNQ